MRCKFIIAFLFFSLFQWSCFVGMNPKISFAAPNVSLPEVKPITINVSGLSLDEKKVMEKAASDLPKKIDLGITIPWKTPMTFAYVANAYTEQKFHDILPTLQFFDGSIVPVTVIYSPELMKQLRKANPNQVILPYIGAADMPTGGIWQEVWKGVADEWIVKDPQGKKITFWGNQPILNWTPFCPLVGGKTWNDYLVDFMYKDWGPKMPEADGWWIDYIWLWAMGQFGFQGPDFNRDGIADHPYDQRDSETKGTFEVVRKFREKNPNAFLGTNTFFVPGLNSIYFESFPQGQSIREALDYIDGIKPYATKPFLSALHIDNPDRSPTKALDASVLSLLISDPEYPVAASETFGPTDHSMSDRWPVYDAFDLGKPTQKYQSLQTDESVYTETFPEHMNHFQQVSLETMKCFQFEKGGGLRLMSPPGTDYLDCVTGMHPIRAGGNYEIEFEYEMVRPGFFLVKVQSGDHFLIGKRIFDREARVRKVEKFTVFGDADTNWHLYIGVKGAEVILHKFTVRDIGSLLVREFDNGLVAKNTSLATKQVPLKKNKTYYQLDGKTVSPGTEFLSIAPNEPVMLSFTPPKKKVATAEMKVKFEILDPFQGKDCGAPPVKAGVPITWSTDGCFRINKNIVRNPSEKVFAVGDNNGWALEGVITEVGPKGDLFTDDGKGGLFIFRPSLCKKVKFTALQKDKAWATYQKGQGVSCGDGGCYFEIDCAVPFNQ